MHRRVGRVFETHQGRRAEWWVSKTRPPYGSHGRDATGLAHERHRGPRDVEDLILKADVFQRPVNLDRADRAGEIMPDDPAAGAQHFEDIERVGGDMPEVVGTVDEGEVDPVEPAEIVAQRVGGDEKDLGRLAEGVGQPAEVLPIGGLVALPWVVLAGRSTVVPSVKMTASSSLHWVKLAVMCPSAVPISRIRRGRACVRSVRIAGVVGVGEAAQGAAMSGAPKRR